jgi:hypothetical protein
MKKRKNNFKNLIFNLNKLINYNIIQTLESTSENSLTDLLS